MGLQISAVGRGCPGVNNVPGDTFSNTELLKHLQKGLSPWIKIVLQFSKAQVKKAERSLEVFQKVSGIRERQLFINETPFPNECLGAAACIDAIEKIKARDPKFNESKIGGFIFVTDTNDSVFPISGKIVARALGIKPRHFGNASLVCSSILHAIQVASMWMENDPECKYVLIGTCDVTSRLHQKGAIKQPFLFGDQGVAIILEKKEGAGGFISSNLYLDTDAPDIVHVPLYSGDSSGCRRNFSHTAEINSNDDNLKLFGQYETRAIAGLYKIFIEQNRVLNGSTPIPISSSTLNVKGEISSDEIFVLPQIAVKIAKDSATNAGINCSTLDGKLARSSVPKHAITGAAGTPLALHYLDSTRSITEHPWTAFFCGIGGANGILQYNPDAKKGFQFGFDIDPNSFLQSNGHEQELTQTEVPIVEAMVTNNGFPHRLHFNPNQTLDEIVDAHIKRPLHI